MTLRRFLFSSFIPFIFIGLVSFSPIEDDEYEICFNLENSVVSAYLRDARNSYTDSIGRVGVSRLNYMTLGTDQSPYLEQVVEQYDQPNWAELPLGVPLPTKGGAYIHVSASADFHTRLSFPVECDTTIIYNLIPQKVYWYKVFDNSDVVISKGLFKTLGQLRMIKSHKVFNVRDIGGWPCDGGRLAYGKLIRSARLEDMEKLEDSSYDIDIFRNKLGIGVELDLREKSINNSPLGPDVKYYWKEMQHYMYLMTNTYWSSSSSQVKSGSYFANLKYCLEKIVSNLQQGKAIVVHCSYGADRAGTVMMIIEALCGVPEPDLVTEWELSSFTGRCYRKYIDQEELSYYYMSGDTLMKTYAEMRSLFHYLYDNYGGKEGASFREQVISWLETNVFNDTSDMGASLIESLRQQLIMPNLKSPAIIRDLSREGRENLYATSFDSTIITNSAPHQMVSASDAKIMDIDVFSTTDFIDCAGYSRLLVNVAVHDVAAFYDKDKCFIKGLRDTSVSFKESMGGDFLQENREYSIPTDAFYVKFNIPTDMGWTAVLSAESLLHYTGEGAGFKSISTDTIDSLQSDIWYSLDGHRLKERPTSRGLFLHQGRKVFVK